MTRTEFLEIAREKHGFKYKYPNLKDKIRMDEDVDILYNDILYKQKVVKHIHLGRCPEKNTPTKTTEQFISESRSVWGDKYDYSLTEYKGALKKVKLIYESVIFEQVAISNLRGLAPELNMNQDYFIKKSIDKWGNKYDYSLVGFKNAHKKVKIIYNGDIYEQTPTNHLMYAPEKKILNKTTEEFINECKITHDNKYTYEKTIYTLSKNKVIITCPTHGDFEIVANSHTRGMGCFNCNESQGEKEIAKILKKYKINFDRQKKFPDCRNIFELPFDFYIPSRRLCIEFDGKQHFEAMDFFGGESSFETIRINDKIKTEYCEDNYINLIRIRYNEMDSIEKILKPLFGKFSH